MFRTRSGWKRKLARIASEAKGNTMRCIKNTRTNFISGGEGDWGQLGHGETRGKWWPTLTKKSNESLARPSKEVILGVRTILRERSGIGEDSKGNGNQKL